MSRIPKATVLVVVIVAVVFGIYAAVAFPKTVVSFPVSFTIGAETKTEEFNVQWLHGSIQVEIKIQLLEIRQFGATLPHKEVKPLTQASGQRYQLHPITSHSEHLA